MKDLRSFLHPRSRRGSVAVLYNEDRLHRASGYKALIALLKPTAQPAGRRAGKPGNSGLG